MFLPHKNNKNNFQHQTVLHQTVLIK